MPGINIAKKDFFIPYLPLLQTFLSYNSPVPLTPPNLARIDKATNLLTDDSCPDGYYESFLPGTSPMRKDS
jgi:hypothetical protein